MPQVSNLRKNKGIFTKTKGNWKKTFQQGGMFLQVPDEQCMYEKKNDMGGEMKRAIVLVEEKNIKRGFIEKKWQITYKLLALTFHF